MGGRRLVAGIIVAIVPLSFAPEACACSCFYATQEEHFERAEFVFVGVVTDRRDPAEEAILPLRQDSIEYTFDVEVVEKGQVDDPAKVWTDRQESACGFSFRTGVRYRVFGYFDDSGKMWTNFCSGTRYLEEEQPTDEPSPRPTKKAPRSPRHPSTLGETSTSEVSSSPSFGLTATSASPTVPTTSARNHAMDPRPSRSSEKVSIVLAVVALAAGGYLLITRMLGTRRSRP